MMTWLPVTFGFAIGFECGVALAEGVGVAAAERSGAVTLWEACSHPKQETRHFTKNLTPR
jgi:hypothetical protein